MKAPLPYKGTFPISVHIEALMTSSTKSADISQKLDHFMIFMLKPYREGIELVSGQILGHGTKK